MKPRMVLVAFLLMLYIGPSLFAASYASPTIPTEQNMSKDFAIAIGESWYAEDWHYRKSITLSIDSGIAGTDYQVRIPVTYDSNMDSDFEDIVFTDNNGSTRLDHWKESFTASTSAVFWVEVADYQDDNSALEIYMYWGNAAASDASDGHATFLFYEDWSEQSLANWTIPSGQEDGQTTWSVTDATHGGYVAKIEGDSADSYIIHSDLAIVAPFATMFRANVEETTVGNTARIGTGWAGAYGWAFLQGAAGTETFAVIDDDANADSQAMDATYYDAWTTFQITRNGTYAELFANDALIETGSFAPDIISNPVMSFQNIDSEDDIYSDWVAVRKFLDGTDPVIDSWGSEEDNFPPPEWELIESVDIIFSVPVDETGLNIFLIIFGLCLIPLSTMYLVRGGRNDMSTDKFFYGLIIFFMGWGLFLGGILV